MATMSALRQRAAHYVRGRNGNMRSNDPLARLLEKFDSSQVIRILITAMELPENPYEGLNPGQQSMNLRNRARGAIRNGELSLQAVKTAIRVSIGH